MPIETEKLRRLLDVGRSLVTELDPERVLSRILEEAQALTDARYVALGVMNEERAELERFLTLGLSGRERAAIGELPRGKGVLGVLIQDPQPLRLMDVGSHPQSFGFPAGHPVMSSFLGVPIVIRGEAWGNLYLTDKRDADEFSEEDETAVSILADLAATAIDNARMYERSEQRRIALEQAVHALEAARDITDAIGASGELDRILELVVKRGRALVRARALLIMLRDGEELVVAAAAGHVSNSRGRRLTIQGSTSGEVLESQIPRRVANLDSNLRISPANLGVKGARTALLMPIVHKGAALGVLVAFDRENQAGPFTQEDEQLLRTFAASAGNAVAISRSVAADRLRSTIAAADAERGRWARELHDQTLQALAGLRVGLSGALRRNSSESYAEAVSQAIEDIELEISNLRGIIADLRPALLDDLGLKAALEALLDRRRADGLEIEAVIQLPAVLDDDTPVYRNLETTVYRLVQESLTNVVKHAGASRVQVRVVSEGDETLVFEMTDDGRGFDPAATHAGFGLAGMRERAVMLGGTLEIESAQSGTTVRARIPVSVAGASAQQVVM